MSSTPVKFPKLSGLLVFELVLSILMLALGVYILLSEAVAFPSRYGGNENIIERPATFFVGCFPIIFSVLIFLKRFFPEASKKYGSFIILTGAVLFIVGYAFI